MQFTMTIEQLAIIGLIDMNPITPGFLGRIACGIGGTEGIASKLFRMLLNSVKQLVEDTVANHGRIDLMFNNAGIGRGVRPHTTVPMNMARFAFPDIKCFNLVYHCRCFNN